jgi:hypothetical protein
MRLTREAFAELFGVHLPAAVPCAWVKGVCFVFVEGTAEIEELERLCGGVCRTENINANHYFQVAIHVGGPVPQTFVLASA